MTNAQFITYVRYVLLKGVKITGIKLTPTNNPKVVAATAKEPGYPGITHLYIYSRVLQAPSFKPVQILQKTFDVFKPLQSLTFDNTGNIAIIREGNIYSKTSTLSIYGMGRGNLITTLNVPSMDANAVTIVDNPGSRLTITIYVPKYMGTQIVFNVTASGATIVSRNDHYIPANVLNALPTTVSNRNVRVYVTGPVANTYPKEIYHFFTKTGVYMMSATKSFVISSYGGGHAVSIGSPDVSSDSKYVAIAYSERRYSTGCMEEQHLRIYDTKGGKQVKDIILLAPTQDTVKGIKFAPGSSGLVEVVYAKAGVTTYDITTGKPVITNEQFEAFIRRTLLPNANITGLTFAPTHNPTVVAAVVKVGVGYDQMTYLYVYSRVLPAPGAAPTQILQRNFNSCQPLQNVTFDDTGNVAIIRQGSVYYYSPGYSYGNLYIYGTEKGDLITKMDVLAMADNVVEIVDTPGSRITINVCAPNTMGTQLVLNVTSTGTTIVSRNDHYIPAGVLNKLPATVSNSNVLVYITTPHFGTYESDMYHFFKKDGTYIMSATKEACISSYHGYAISAIGSPDASADNKYIAIAYEEQRFYTGVYPEQRLNIHDTQTGKIIKSITLLAPTQDTVNSIKFAPGSSSLIEVNYAKAGLVTYDIVTGLQKNNNVQLDEALQRLDVLAAKNQSLPGNITSNPNMAGNDSIASQLVKK